MQRRRRIAERNDERHEHVEKALGQLCYHLRRPRIRRRSHVEVLRDLPIHPRYWSLGYAYWMAALAALALFGIHLMFYLHTIGFDVDGGLEVRLRTHDELSAADLSRLDAGRPVLDRRGKVVLDPARDEIHTVSFGAEGTAVLDDRSPDAESPSRPCRGRRHLILVGPGPERYQQIVDVVDRMLADHEEGGPRRCRVVLVPAVAAGRLGAESESGR